MKRKTYNDRALSMAPPDGLDGFVINQNSNKTEPVC